MKKILINITNGFSLRYICHSEILNELSKEYKIILLSKNANSTKKNIKNENIDYEQINEDEFNKFKFSNKLYNFCELLGILFTVENTLHQKIILKKYSKNKIFLENFFLFF